jgi:DNA-directed RNA polymerase I, II, and III subunit RPABC2
MNSNDGDEVRDGDGGDDILTLQAELAEAQPQVKDLTKVTDPLTILYKHHPESVLDYKETVLQKLPLTSILPGAESVLDQNHKSPPFLTQYEKTRVLGFRANQLAQGAPPFVHVQPHILHTLDIARQELAEKKLPFIIKRPMPDGTFEYWRLRDLLIL